VEEEFFLVDTRGHLVQKAQATLVDATAPDVDLQAELLGCQVESATRVCRYADELVDELRELRARLAKGSQRHGARLLATSTTVRAEHIQPKVAPHPRYLRMAEHLGALVFSGTTCGCHVHVGIEDRPTALAVSNHLRPWLPTLLALSANSPFHGGTDTGYASTRYVMWARWPTAGPPPYLESVDQYESIVQATLHIEAALDRKMIYWDVRISEHQPTLEVRVCDVAGTAEEAALYGVLVRALVGVALDRLASGQQAPRLPHEVLRAGLWRAARDGLAGQCPDPETGQLRPVHEILANLRYLIEPELRRTGELPFVDKMLEWLKVWGGGANRQRAAYERTARLTDVVDFIAEQTLRSI
jgi:carboxylate-amine ligase